MAIKINIGKILTTMIWGCIGAGVLVLLVAAIRYRNSNSCKGFVINVTGNSLPKKEILALLNSSASVRLQDRPIQSFDLRHLETTLERNIWIQKSRLFFDNNNLLHVDVIERSPVTRVFGNDGASFYFDSTGVRLPLTQMPVKLPVFTGYPVAIPGHRGSDSLLNAGIRQISAFLRANPIWMDRIGQVSIMADRTFELQPESGHYRIGLGDGNNAEEKFHRLQLFYQQVLERVGSERYSRIDVSYAGQVVATRKGAGERRYDSLQALANIRQLIRSAQQLQPDTLRQQSVRPLETSNMTEQNLSTHDLVPGAADTPTRKPKP